MNKQFGSSDVLNFDKKINEKKMKKPSKSYEKFLANLVLSFISFKREKIP